jgi:WXG100 family type VII secretion target
MVGELKITPEELRAAAGKCNGYATDMSNFANTIYATLSALKANWIGASSNAFIESYEINYKTLLESNIPELLNGVATQLTVAANTLESTDADLAAQFRQG